MNREIIEQAVQSIETWGASPAQIRSAIEKAVFFAIAEEREECAKIADSIDVDLSGQRGPTTNAKRAIVRTVALRIRARSIPSGEKRKGE